MIPTDNKHRIDLDQREITCLRNVIESPRGMGINPTFRNMIQASSSTTICVSRIQAEELRDLLTRELAISGFDADYAPNQLGVVLETLIDKLYIGERD